MKFNRKIFIFVLLLVIAVAIQDIFINRYSPYRYITQFTQLLAVLAGSLALFKFIANKRSYQFIFNRSFLLFFIILFFYASFSKYFTDWYPRVLFTLLPFFVFYNVTKLGINVDKSLQYFSITTLIIGVYQLYLGFFTRQELYGDILERADNVGYTLLGTMMIISILKCNKSNFILISIAFFAALLSLKRGAMVSASVLYIFYILQYRKYANLRLRFINSLFGFGALFTCIYAVNKYLDILLYRFINDPTGSSRERFYTLILDGWLDSHTLNKLLGNGFFSTIDYLGITFGHKIYAHSDWLEILYDHGLIGVFVFLIMFISLYLTSYHIKKHANYHYLPFLGILLVFFIKSIISGTYMSKFDFFLYGALGLVLGHLDFNKRFKVQSPTT